MNVRGYNDEVRLRRYIHERRGRIKKKKKIPTFSHEC